MNSSSVSNSELHNGVPLEQVFSEYYDAHSDAIFRFCFFQTGDRNISLDIMQETFTKAWEALTAGTVLENPRAFLYRVAKTR